MYAAVGSLLRKRLVEDGFGCIFGAFVFIFVVLDEILVVAMAWVGGRSIGRSWWWMCRKRNAIIAKESFVESPMDSWLLCGGMYGCGL